MEATEQTTEVSTEGADPGATAAPAEAPAPAADAAPAPAQPAADGEPEPVAATPEEARRNNYVPYDKFRDSRRRMQEAEDRERRSQERIAELERERVARFAQPAPQQPVQPEIDEDDPIAVARATRQDFARFRMETEAKERAAIVRQQIGAHVSDLGFRNAQKAQAAIEERLAFGLQRTGILPDIETVARELRHEELETEKAVINDYMSRKKQPAATAAAPRPASPPVVETSAKKATGFGRDSLNRVLSRLRG